MLRFFLCFMFFYPSLLPASDIFDPFSTSFSPDQRALLSALDENEESSFSDENMVPMVEILALNSIQEVDRSLRDLPEELILSILFVLDKQDLVNSSQVSQQFKSYVRHFIPNLTRLPRSPSCLKVLALLKDVEEYEKNKHPFSEQDIYEVYFSELLRLKQAEELVRYSPYFMEAQGSQRILKILEKHKIQIPEDSLSFRRRLCSSFMRDPIVLSMTIFGLVGMTSLGTWWLYTTLTNVETSQRYYDSYLQSGAYKMAYEENLRYVQSGDYYNSFIHVDERGVQTIEFKAPRDCGIGRSYMPPITRTNRTIFCNPELMNSEFENFSLRGGPNVKGDFMGFVSNMFADSITPQEIKTFFLGVADKVCETGIMFGEFLQKSTRADPAIYTNVCGGKADCPWKRNLEKGVIELVVNPFKYDTACIARKLTYVPEIIPYPTLGIIGWSVGIAGGWFISIVLCIVGWSWFV